MNFLACCRISFLLRYRQGYRVFPIVSSYLIGQQLRIVTGIKMQSRGQANGSERHDEHNDSVKRPTRSEIKQKEKENRDFYLQMGIEEKRKLYKCKKKFNTLDDIPTWNKYYHENKAHLLKKLGKKKTKPLYEVNEKINHKVSIWKGDITSLEIDAIVNAANSSLLGGGGVDGAIHEAAGKKLVEECVTLNGCKTGEAKITGGYKLPAKYVIHTVGPIGEKEMLLRNAYENSLKVMIENKLRSLALPCISTGIYGYDNQKACHVALKVVRKFLTENADSVDRVIFCLFLPKDVDLYEENMQIYFPVETTEDSKEMTSIDADNEKSAETTKSKTKGKDDSVTKTPTESQKAKDKEGTSSDVEMEIESETISKIETQGDSQGKENVKASESEDKEEINSDVEMKEAESTIKSKEKTKGGSTGKEKVKASESKGKEKTSSNADKEKSAETTKSKTKGKDNSVMKTPTESQKVKDKKEISSDVEMKEIESTIESKHKTKDGSASKEKVQASESEGHDRETDNNKRNNENEETETDDKQLGKCEPVQTSRM